MAAEIDRQADCAVCCNCFCKPGKVATWVSQQRLLLQHVHLADAAKLKAAAGQVQRLGVGLDDVVRGVDLRLERRLVIAALMTLAASVRSVASSSKR